MTKFALRGLLSRKLRTILTAFAIVLGVATVSGTYVLTDSIGKAFDSIFTEVRQGSDAVISGKSAFDLDNSTGSAAPAFDQSLLARVRALPDVAEAEGSVSGEAQLIGKDGKAIVYGGAPNLGFSIANGASRFNPLTLVEGTWPKADEVVVDKATAGKEHIRVGESVGVQANGPVRRLGVSGDQIRVRHPRVIHCAITGYGQTGPYAERPGHDLNYVAVSGFLAADRPGASELPRMFIADVGGGAMSAVIGILAALVGRGRDGEGRSIDVSMHEAALYWTMLPAARELVEGGDRATGELPTFGRHASYNVYRTKDEELIALGALEMKFWRAFCEAVGRPDLIARHESNAADQAALITDVQQIFRARTRDEWLALFRGHDVCLTPVNRPAEALRDPHVLARGAVISAPGLRAILPPFVETTPELRPAPELGADTDDVLRAIERAD